MKKSDIQMLIKNHAELVTVGTRTYKAIPIVIYEAIMKDYK